MQIDLQRTTHGLMAGMHCWRLHRGRTALVVTGLILLLAACMPTPEPTDAFIAPYMELQVCAGEAQIREAGDSDWRPMNEPVGLQVPAEVAAAGEGVAGICFGDGSELELEPGAVVGLEGQHPLPRLQMAVQQGEIRFRTEKRSFEFAVPSYTLDLVGLPMSASVAVEGTTTHLMVDSGSLKTTLETGRLMLFSECEEAYLEPDEDPTVSQFCQVEGAVTASPAATGSPAATSTSTPTSTPTPTGTPTPSVTPTTTPSPTPTPRRRVTRPTATPTPTPLPTATATQAPPPPSQPTKPPPTQPPPTEPPPTEPPPTDTPEPTATATVLPTPTSEPTIIPTP